MSASTEILQSWKDENHRRLRLQPRYTDTDYFHFADLKAFIERHAPRETGIAVLDYGAGSSPYRSLFACQTYKRADIFGDDLDYLIQPDSTIPERDEAFDYVLSTQVAEHVPHPAAYFGECFRLLKPGGTFMVTTHGIWEEHGVPYDFQRWTEEGLSRDLKAAGFGEVDIFKLSCGPRAAILLFSRTLYSTPAPQSALPNTFFRGFRFAYSRLLPAIHRLCDRLWPDLGVVKGSGGSLNAKVYIGIAALARKRHSAPAP